MRKNRPRAKRYRYTEAMAMVAETRRLVAAFALAVTMLSLAPLGSALAHTALLSSDPPDNGVIDEVPESVVLDFAEPIRARSFRLDLLASDGRQIPLRDVRVGRRTVTAVAPRLDAGEYQLGWAADSEDGRHINGEIRFTIVGAGSGGFLVAHLLHILAGTMMVAVAAVALGVARRRGLDG